MAVLIPCFNEATTVDAVVREFQSELPDATIYVFDNNSTDGTGAIAAAAGAVVVDIPRQGKGNVARAQFRQVDADYFVMIDGDSTYPAAAVHDLLDPVITGECDMAVGRRTLSYDQASFPRYHLWGNRMIGGLVRRLFQTDLEDVLSGYRCFSRELVRSIPILSPGFELEAEITCRTLHRGFVVREYPIHYRSRPQGSSSKLSTWRDGLRIAVVIARLFKDYRPLAACSVLAAAAFLVSLLFGAMVVYDWWLKNSATKVASAVLASGMGLLAILFLSVGLLLDTFNRRHDELVETVLKSGSGRRARRGPTRDR